MPRRAPSRARAGAAPCSSLRSLALASSSSSSGLAAACSVHGKRRLSAMLCHLHSNSAHLISGGFLVGQAVEASHIIGALSAPLRKRRKHCNAAASAAVAAHLAPEARPRLSTTVCRLNFGSSNTPEKRWSISTRDLACVAWRPSRETAAAGAPRAVTSAPLESAQTAGCCAPPQTARPRLRAP